MGERFPIRVLGRQFEHLDLLELQSWIDQQTGWSRRQLSVGLAERWDWRNARGQLRDLATRLLLNRLESRGLVRLPTRQKRGGRRWVRPALGRQLTRNRKIPRVLPLQGGVACGGRADPGRRFAVPWADEFCAFGADSDPPEIGGDL